MKVVLMILIGFLVYEYWPIPCKFIVKASECARIPQIGGIPGPISMKEHHCALKVRQNFNIMNYVQMYLTIDFPNFSVNQDMIAMLTCTNHLKNFK